jgi:hypothetical protein
MRIAVLLFVLLAFFAVNTRADVDVLRLGEENPVLTIAKATFWGGVAGALVGGALALIADDNHWDYIKWGIAGGVLGGCAFGVYHVMTRPSAKSSLLETDGDGLALNLPTLEIDWTGNEGTRQLDTRMTVFSYSF